MADESKKDGDRVHGDSSRGDKRYGPRASAARPGNDRSGTPSRSERAGGSDGPRRGPRSAREDRPRTVGDHPGARKNRDHQPNRRTDPTESGRPSSRYDSQRRDDRGYRGRPGNERGDRSRYDRGDRPEGSARHGRSERPARTEREQRPFEPQVPAGITGKELDRDFHDELRGLSRETAERVSQHVVAAYVLEASDPEASQAHAKFAARIGARIGAVREAYGILAYRSGDYRTAVRELRTSLRITGRIDVLPMIADSERGMGRPERALDIAASDDASELGADAAIELMIVVAGAYADTGDVETALGTLEIPALRHKIDGRWQVRLWVAYSDLLARAGRQEESKRWLTLAADADTEGLTDAAARLGRPMPQPVDVSWHSDEELSVIDAYEEDADTSEDAETPEDRATPEDPESVDAVVAEGPAGEQPREAVLATAQRSSPEERS